MKWEIPILAGALLAVAGCERQLLAPGKRGQPPAGGAVTDSGRLGGLGQRPPRMLDPVNQQLPSF